MQKSSAKMVVDTASTARLNIMVKKFGGTSVGSIERIEAVADRIVKDYRSSGKKQVVAVSAMSGETNRLVKLAQLMHPQYKGLAYDMLLASGEQVSVALFVYGFG